MASESRRSLKTEVLAHLLRRLAPEETEAAVGFLMGEPRQGKVGLSYARVAEAKAHALPAVSATLTVADVDGVLDRLLQTSGAGSVAARRSLLAELLSKATGTEQDFLMRLFAGELRQGALEGVMVDAVAKASGVPVAKIRRAAMLAGDLRPVASAAMRDPARGVDAFSLRLLKPVQPMLAQPAGDVDEALERLTEAALEYKVDGARFQLHKAGDEVRLFSRSLHDVTHAAPEIVEAARRLPAETVILDGEAIALSPEQRPLPFAHTMRRFGRKLDVESLRQEIPLSAYYFDVLHWNGEDLIDKTGAERFEALSSVLHEVQRIPRFVTSDPRLAEAFFAKALKEGHEGLMAKSLRVPYEAGNRGTGWLKIKPAHTLDLVVLAVEWGSGRRKGYLSNLHLGARNPEGGFVMLGKTFKGMTDEMLAWQTDHLKKLQIAEDAYTVYVRPELVVEIAFDGVVESPQYPGGVALRFARVKHYRPEKSASEADTIETVQKLYPGP